MQNFVQHGSTLTLTAPVGGVVGGVPYLIGELFGVAAGTADAAKKFDLARVGVFTFPKTAGEAWAEGDQLYWDAATDSLTTTAATNHKVAVAVAASAATFGNAVIVVV